MSWRRVFRGRLYVRDSLWVLPLAGALLGAALGLVDVRVDETVHLPPQLQYSPSTASTVLAAIVGATAALTGFVVTVTTLVVQMATGTFSARYMRLWYRDRMLKVLLALLVGTLAFSFSLMRRVESNFVPNLGVTIAGVLLIVSLLVFSRVPRPLPAPAATGGGRGARPRLLPAQLRVRGQARRTPRRLHRRAGRRRRAALPDRAQPATRRDPGSGWRSAGRLGPDP